jgi:hypothetical protein
MRRNVRRGEAGPSRLRPLVNANSTRSSPTLWLAAVAGLTFTVQAVVSRTLYWDAYYDLTAGRFIAAHGLPTHEVMTVAGRSDWIDQQWLAHLVLYSAWSVGGYAAVVLLCAAAVTFSYTLLAVIMNRDGVPPSRMLFWSYAALFVALGSTVIRSQSLALPLAVLVIFVIVADYRRPAFRWHFLLVLVPLVGWANVHGSVLLGASLTAIYSAGRAVLLFRRGDRASAARYALVTVLAAAAIFATPYGLDVVGYYTALIGNDSVRRYIQEWAPPALGDPLSIGYFFVLIATIAVGLYAVHRRYRPPAVLVVSTIVLGVLSLTALRFAIWFGLAAALLDANVLAHTRPHSRPFPRRFILLTAGTFVATACLAALVLVATPSREFERVLPTNSMAAIAGYAQAHPGTLILTDELASALIWHEPAAAGTLGFDTRLEQYESASLEKWFAFLNLAPPGWPALTDCYSAILVSSGRPNLTSALASLPGWTTLTSEPAGTAFVRLDPGRVTTGTTEPAPPDPGSAPTADSASRCGRPRGSGEP